MSTHFVSVAYVCKVCKQPRVAKADAEAMAVGFSKDWCNRLAAKLTCDRCYDFITNRSVAVERIGRICGKGAIIAAHGNRVQREAWASSLTEIRKKLTKLTQAYGIAVAGLAGGMEAPWDTDIVDMLVESPAKWNVILGEQAKMVRAFVNEKRVLV